MKRIISLLTFISLFISNTKAQDAIKHVSHKSPYYHNNAVTIIGISTIGVGIAIAFYGFENNLTNKKNVNNDYKETIGVGAALILIGSGLAIGSGIYYRSHYHKVTLISTKKNEIGIAYNF